MDTTCRGGQPPAWSWPARHEGAGPHGYLVRVAVGLLWRFALVGVVTLGALVSPAVPLAGAVGVLLGSQVISLRGAPGAAAPLWRTGLIALALAVSSGLALYPRVVAAGLIWVGVEPWILGGRRRGPGVRGLRTTLVSWLGDRGAPARRTIEGPEALDIVEGWG